MSATYDLQSDFKTLYLNSSDVGDLGAKKIEIRAWCCVEWRRLVTALELTSHKRALCRMFLCSPCASVMSSSRTLAPYETWPRPRTAPALSREQIVP